MAQKSKRSGSAQKADQNPVKKADLPVETPVQSRRAQGRLRTQVQFAGPLPPPTVLAQYDEIIPNGADRLLGLAERQAAHRQYLEKTVIESDKIRSMLGLILGFILASGLGGGGIYLMATGVGGFGFSTILLTLASLVGTFMYGHKSRKQERREADGSEEENNSRAGDDHP
jgi:uncharacterized membrane protein